MEYKLTAKTLITKVKPTSSWFSYDYNFNIYRGCNHQCVYCDSRSECYQNNDFLHVYYKENCLAILEQELKTKKKSGVIATGSMSDPYNHLEKRLRLTRQALLLINKYRFGVAIITKSDLIVEDIDVLKQIAIHSPILVKLTITTFDHQLAALLEPGAPSPNQRFAAIKKLIDNNIYAGIILMPLLPFINDTPENIINIVQQAAKAGAKFIYFAPLVTLRDRQKEYFFNKLLPYYPDLKEKYQSTKNNNYVYYCPNYRQLYELFCRECEKYHILYKINDINCDFLKAYQKLTLF